jgi:hypothetical protein
VSTASTAPSSVRNRTLRSRTSSRLTGGSPAGRARRAVRRRAG